MRTLSLATAILYSALLVPTAFAEGALDGKTFAGDVGEKGKPASEKDEISFQEGQFQSKACDPYGFGSAAYTAKAEDGAITFEAVTRSEKEGEIRWAGKVTGDTLEATYVWIKAGQDDINYWVKATLKKGE